VESAGLGASNSLVNLTAITGAQTAHAGSLPYRAQPAPGMQHAPYTAVTMQVRVEVLEGYVLDAYTCTK